MTFRLFSVLIALGGYGAVAGGPPSDRLVVIDTIVGHRYVHSAAKFGLNEETGRAWVEAMVDNGGIGDDYDSYTSRSRVQNLSYDAQAREIVYNVEGSRVICARVTHSKFLFVTRTDIRGTGRCELLARLESRTNDDGFQPQTSKRLIVELRLFQAVPSIPRVY